jgi:hypothetical protein
VTRVLGHRSGFGCIACFGFFLAQRKWIATTCLTVEICAPVDDEAMMEEIALDMALRMQRNS